MNKKNAHARSNDAMGTSSVTRRTVTRGIAWTAPVVAVAAAAPAFAASCQIGLDLDLEQSCKKANANDYRLVFKIVTTGSCAVPAGCTATITKVTETTGQARVLFEGSKQAGEPVLICDANNLAAFLSVTATISCDGGTSKDYIVKANQFTNSASTCVGTDFCA